MQTLNELAALRFPWPTPPRDLDDTAEVVSYQAACEEVTRAREEYVESRDDPYRTADEDGAAQTDPLLSDIAEARQAMLAAEHQIRRLLAYGREFARPRPYRLIDLAAAAGMSISGVRTAYDEDEIADVAEAIERPARTTGREDKAR
ncbi:MAG: hypothetical protein GXX79_13755 [Actinomycetales bacterium]|nr:hypothetical protein [Actinomycetales bacterium]